MKAGFWEILLVVILVLILFGHAKIPEMMKNLAAGWRAFKQEIKDDKKEIIPEFPTVTKKSSAPKKKKSSSVKKSVPASKSVGTKKLKNK